jgi:hypothetical protein
VSASDHLLSRDTFRAATLARDGHRCVMCGRTADDGVRLDAHHIVERRLFRAPHEAGGYFLDNGATLCDDGTMSSCHLRAEATLISCEEIRRAAGIARVVLPEHLYADQRYTKWGDPLLDDGRRMRGELFWDESVQKVLAQGGVLHLYTKYVRYPRTYHLPFSPKVLVGDTGDDRVMRSTEALVGKRVIVTVKMDGSQATAYDDYLHGRTVDFKSNVTWHWLQNFHRKFAHEIPAGYRLNLENLWGGVTQDIEYRHLPLYVMAFMMWDERNYCLSWDESLEWFGLLGEVLRDAGVPQGLPHVPVLYDGMWDEDLIHGLHRPTYGGDPMEGFVVRRADRFHYADFRYNVGKYVRAEHKVRHDGPLRQNQIVGG